MQDFKWYRFGPFSFDGRLLWRDGERRERIDLPGREAGVLACLLASHPHVVRRQDLLAEVVGRASCNNDLDGVVMRLRNLLGDVPLGRTRAGRFQYIDTVPREGYLFAHPIERRSELPPNDELRDGMKHWNRRDPSALRDALRLFDDIVRREPRFGAAHAALGDCYAILGSYWIQPRDAAAKAKAAARGALALDRGLAQPHATLGFVHSLFEQRWSDAAHDLQTALSRAPDSSTARHWYALHLAATGDPARAGEQIAIARGADPLSRIIDVHAAAILYWGRAYDAAERQCQRAVESFPGFWYSHHKLGLVLEAQGRLDAALAEQQAAIRVHTGESPMLRAALARTHALRGERAKARAELAKLRACPRGRAGSFHAATAYAALGEAGAALRSLDDARRQGDVWCSFLALDPRLDSLRRDRRFRQLSTDMAVPVFDAAPRRMQGKRLTALLRALEL